MPAQPGETQTESLKQHPVLCAFQYRSTGRRFPSCSRGLGNKVYFNPRLAGSLFSGFPFKVSTVLTSFRRLVFCVLHNPLAPRVTVRLRVAVCEVCVSRRLSISLRSSSPRRMRPTFPLPRPARPRWAARRPNHAPAANPPRPFSHGAVPRSLRYEPVKSCDVT